eukprot:CAMPEP_0119311802 /NCGR_PEP_ID=MMETSP1333-20130426/23903_1 /TAXON_ID=418940 /ORGANISM="Scyphosphaera apsteinii, Strain RCC1455" /LENGTH=160 /DNA_ID=CAMNT_0007316275 /DNA_START=17 /DNA_END=499 /DNA_ORIENTATION=+
MASQDLPSSKPRFAAAKIKKLMQIDEDVGRISVGVPPMVSKCLELFAGELISKAAAAAQKDDSKIVQISHITTCAESKELAFLRDTIENFAGVPTVPTARKRGVSSGKGSGAAKRQCTSAAVDAIATLPLDAMPEMLQSSLVATGSPSGQNHDYDEDYDA